MVRNSAASWFLAHGGYVTALCCANRHKSIRINGLQLNKFAQQIRADEVCRFFEKSDYSFRTKLEAKIAGLRW